MLSLISHAKRKCQTIIGPASVLSQKFVEEAQPMAAVGSDLKSPFFKGGIFSVGLKPLFGKEGKGRFGAEAVRNYVANFWVTTLGEQCSNGTDTH